ncbi:MAG: hypothetical protein M3033_11580 [Acidobacteriota bacterium]|nr:hypothetical protein [Acidobacteriota bacterium]
MSTATLKFSISFLICIEFLLCAFTVPAQKIEADIKINSTTTEVRVEGKFLQENGLQSSRNWVFLNSLAGAENLGERISGLELKDKQGQNISVKKFSPAEYLAQEATTIWNYNINLDSPKNPNAMAHVSWLAGEQGILMLGDLLPQFSVSGDKPTKARVKFDLPKSWLITSSEKEISENVFEIENIDKAVFIIGKNWREREISVGEDKLNFTISGDWQFSDEEAQKTAADIFTKYKKLFGEIPNRKIQVSLVHFPRGIKFGRWEAETRGANLTILSSDMPFKALSLQRLHEQLRHELFHLWIPNNLALTGNYDWFYEGFTVYQALRTGVEMNQIRFEDFLDTLAQAYNLDTLQTQKTSLVEASKTRWSGAPNTQVYARGMIVAFLCDVALLRQSRGKKSVSDIFEKIYKTYRLPNKRLDGNAAIFNTLKGYGELDFVVEKYIKGTEKIDWQADLESAGIEAIEENSFARLKIKAKPNRRQKDLLDELGYNNWRRISAKAK